MPLTIPLRNLTRDLSRFFGKDAYAVGPIGPTATDYGVHKPSNVARGLRRWSSSHRGEKPDVMGADFFFLRRRDALAAVSRAKNLEGWKRGAEKGYTPTVELSNASGARMVHLRYQYNSRI